MTDQQDQKVIYGDTKVDMNTPIDVPLDNNTDGITVGMTGGVSEEEFAQQKAQAAQPGMAVAVQNADNVPQIPASDNKDLILMIERVAMNPQADIGKMQALLEMREKLEAKEAEKQFNYALACLQSEIPAIKRRGSVSYDKEKGNKAAGQEKAFNFARYEDVMDVLQPLLSKYGLSVSFNSEWSTTDGPTVHGTIAHVSGHKKTTTIRLPMDSSGGKNNLQAMGSTISYAQRYILKMFTNFTTVGEDDDGVSGGQDEKTIDVAVAADLDTRIRALADGDTYMPKFLGYMKVEKLLDILASDLQKAQNAITQKERNASAQPKSAQVAQ